MAETEAPAFGESRRQQLLPRPTATARCRLYPIGTGTGQAAGTCRRTPVGGLSVVDSGSHRANNSVKPRFSLVSA